MVPIFKTYNSLKTGTLNPKLEWNTQFQAPLGRSSHLNIKLPCHTLLKHFDFFTLFFKRVNPGQPKMFILNTP